MSTVANISDQFENLLAVLISVTNATRIRCFSATPIAILNVFNCKWAESIYDILVWRWAVLKLSPDLIYAQQDFIFSERNRRSNMTDGYTDTGPTNTSSDDDI